MDTITSRNYCDSQSVMFVLLTFFQVYISIGSDTIFTGHSLSGNQTINSPSRVFEMGFFTPALKLLENGNLTLLNESKTVVWSTNSTSRLSNSTIGVLLDNGNFVIRDSFDSSVVLWQSFDHPTDTWLPGGKVGYNKVNNEKLVLRPWKNPQNPAPGIFSNEVEQNGTRHFLLWNDSKSYWTIGYWNGKIFSLVPEIELDEYVTNITYVSNENESYYTYDATYSDALTRFMIETTGQLRQYVWGKDFGRWNLYWMRPLEQCEVYGFCGSFGKCNQHDMPLCVCLEGFEPKRRKDGELGYHSDGCVRKTPLECSKGGFDEFLVMPNVRLPSNSESLAAQNVVECRLACLSNCSCSAYAYDNQCSIWTGDLFNLKQLSPDERVGKYLHLRLAASDLAGFKTSKRKTSPRIAIATVLIVGLFFLSGIVAVFMRRRCFVGASETLGDSVVLFKYRDLKAATKNFSEKLGEGGFGVVFKGTLPNSTSIAVKKLKSLKQGEQQFRTEVKTIGTIQHVNLVRLRGFCAENSRRFLVYDYVPKGSLESRLFRKSLTILDWKVRYQIAIGTAKGLCYLHEECRDCIIHCDIKPENILLDEEYNPKIADFGLAKLVGRDFSRVLKTMRGTRGYLAPEWISGEAITSKADVFSYGMLLFELISGRRNSGELLDG
ncbi:Serine/threonine protein kinase [Trema orientale]|uniref:non-specific serine/threonine protein kinase n=1 Tax=Trema orientale TaxID=63057 RepID=A0A2P5DNJ7_TREOI|nr:Serine/threonine protein kinase [Trema orientale]